MPLALYMDHMFRVRSQTDYGLRSVDVLIAYEDGASEFDDPVLLDRASSLGRVLFSQDEDLLIETARRRAEGIFFAGLVYAHQRNISVGDCVRDLELIAHVLNLDEVHDQVLYLPL